MPFHNNGDSYLKKTKKNRCKKDTNYIVYLYFFYTMYQNSSYIFLKRKKTQNADDLLIFFARYIYENSKNNFSP